MKAVNGPGHGGPARNYSWPPFEPGNLAALKHGATSERQIRPLAANHRRRVLRQLRLRAGDVDPIGRAYLESYCRMTAKIVLIDFYLDEHGLLDDAGNPRPCMRLYVQLQNAAVAALAKLERHLRVAGKDPFEVLADHLAAQRREIEGG